MSEGKFYRGAWKDDDPSIVHMFSIKQNPARPDMPICPEMFLDGMKLKGVTGVTLEITGGELNTVSIDFAVLLDVDLPIVDLIESKKEMAENE